MNILHPEAFGDFWIFWLVLLVDLIVRIWLLFYIPRNRKPTAATAWLLLIYIIPVFGTLLFFIIGNTKLSKVRRNDLARITALMKRYSSYLKKVGASANLMGTQAEEPARLAEALTGFTATTGNKVTVKSGYETLLDDMIRSIAHAQQFVYIEFYAIALDSTTTPFFEAIEQAVDRGVEVYVLFDYFGSHKYPRYKDMKRKLTDVGAKWRVILPLRFTPKTYTRPDLRNHRKIVVIDTTDAYIGSLNLIDKTYHRKDDISYIELTAHVQGPAVLELAAVFASDWYAESRETLAHFTAEATLIQPGAQIAQVIPSGPGYPYENNLHYFVLLIAQAHHRVIITNPYLVPDESLLAALLSASLRGVKVSILNSEAMDQWVVGHAQRSYYEQLISAGVIISLYKAPQLVHEKYMVIDDTIAVVGSSNLDRRSFELNHECVLGVYDTATAKKLASHHETLKKQSHTIQLAAWKKRSIWQSFLDSIARLSSALQ